MENPPGHKTGKGFASVRGEEPQLQLSLPRNELQSCRFSFLLPPRAPFVPTSSNKKSTNPRKAGVRERGWGLFLEGAAAGKRSCPKPPAPSASPVRLRPSPGSSRSSAKRSLPGLGLAGGFRPRLRFSRRGVWWLLPHPLLCSWQMLPGIFPPSLRLEHPRLRDAGGCQALHGGGCGSSCLCGGNVYLGGGWIWSWMGAPPRRVTSRGCWVPPATLCRGGWRRVEHPGTEPSPACGTPRVPSTALG